MAAGYLELASGVTEYNLMCDRIEKVTASDGPRTASARRPFQMPLASMDDIFEIGYGSRTPRPPSFSGKDASEIPFVSWVVDFRRLRSAVE